MIEQLSLQPLFDKLDTWLDGAIGMLPNVVLALLVVALFVTSGRMAGQLSQRLGRKLWSSEALAGLFAAVARYTVFAAGLVIALSVVGLKSAVFSILAGAGVVGLAVGFAFQDMTANLIAGVAMAIRRPFEVGDLIETEGGMGRVQAINLRNTVLRTFEGQRLIIPNRSVFEHPITNYQSHGVRRVDIDVGVAYDTDLPHATELARDAVAALDQRAEDTDVDVFARGFGGSAIDLSVRFWIPFPDTDFFQAHHDGIVAVKQAFDANDVEIPFPIRTLKFPAGVTAGAEAVDATSSSPDAEAESSSRAA